MKIGMEQDDQKAQNSIIILMPPRVWRSGLEPAELSFRVPNFFHHTKKPSRHNDPFLTLISLASDAEKRTPFDA